MITLVQAALLACLLGWQTTPTSPSENPAVTALALKIYGQMRTGRVDPTLMTPEMSQQFTPETLAEEKPLFDQLGDPVKITLESSVPHTRGILYTYLATFRTAQFHVQLFVHPDGRFAGYGLTP